MITRLSIAIAKAEFKLKNEGSYLGIAWYLLNPLLTFGLLLVVFSHKLGQDIPHYSLYLLLGIIMFNAFKNVTIESTKIIYDHRLLIKSVKFPLEDLVGSLILKAFYTHIAEIMIFIIALSLSQIPLTHMIFYPFILIVFMIFLYGAALLLSSLTIYFMDLENIWLFAAQLLWLATPIFYSTDHQPLLFLINTLNPLFYFITAARDMIIYTTWPSIEIMSGLCLHTLFFLSLGTLVFNKLKSKITELI